MILRLKKFAFLLEITVVSEDYKILRKKKEMRSGKLHNGGKIRAGPKRKSAVSKGNRSRRREGLNQMAFR